MKTLKTIGLFVILLLVHFQLEAQHQLRTSQFFMNAPALNPAFTGIDDFIDVKLGFRQNTGNFDESPRSYYLGVYGAIKKADPLSFQENSLRISSPTSYDNTAETVKKGLRHGVGLMMFSDQQFALEQIMVSANYALHLTLNRKLKFTVGTSVGLYTREVDVSKLTVKDQDDLVYQSLLMNGARQSFLDISFGTLLYSDKYYFGISAMPLVQSLISSNGGAVEEETSEIAYNLMMGYQFQLSPEWRLQPSLLVTYNQFEELTYEGNIKFRSYESFWTGLSYRSNESVSILLGTTIKKKLSFSYSYDFFFADVAPFNKGSHEIVVGLAILKKTRSRPYTW